MANSEVSSSDTQRVFYCGDCHEILGDSLSIVRLNEELKSVSLQMVTEAVVVTSDCETSIEGSDSGSTFNILNCKSCNGGIGRYYKTTPQSLDCIRDIYSLDLSKVESYYLGSCTSANSVLSFKDPLETLKEDIFKTQSMLLEVHERVKKLESCLEEVIDSNEELFINEKKGSQKKRKTK